LADLFSHPEEKLWLIVHEYQGGLSLDNGMLGKKQQDLGQ